MKKTIKSNGKKATFRLIVHQGRGKEYLAKGTNLEKLKYYSFDNGMKTKVKYSYQHR